MYRDFPFGEMGDLLLHKMKWSWMLLSFIPGILAQVFRGLRWRQTLVPLGEQPRRSTCIYAIFLSYASSLLIPRIGEVMRCGVLTRHERISFAKSLGTVVMERIVDSLLILLMVGSVLLWQLPVIMQFFDLTGVGLQGVLSKFTTTGIIVTAICVATIIALGFFLIRRLNLSYKLSEALKGLGSGIASLRKIKNIPLYIFYSLGIWVAYFLHYWLTFFCFDFTSHMSLTATIVSFCIGTIAVIVPTPNGAGSWHFAVKTILVIYGLGQMEAISFVLIVHSVQTLLLILLGIYALVALQLGHRKEVRP